MAGGEMRPMTLGELLDRTFTLYRRNFLLFLTIMALPQLVILLVSVLFQMAGASMASAAGSAGVVAAGAFGGVVFLVMLFTTYGMIAIGQAATVFAVGEITLGRSTSAMATYGRVGKKFWRVFDVFISTAIRIVIGMFLFIIPGVLLALRYCVSIPVAVLEDMKARDAIKRSTSLTEGRRRDAFVILFVTVAMAWIVSILFNMPVGILLVTFASRGEAPLWINLLSAATNFVSSSLVLPIGSIAIALFYYDCRVRKEAFDLQVMLNSLAPAPAATTPGVEPSQV